jgi:hypothetical protein
MNLMIFCEVAEELVGVSAGKLVDKIKDDDDWYTLPKEIDSLLGSTHTFQVFDKYGDGSFSVWSIMDHVSVRSSRYCHHCSVHGGACSCGQCQHGRSYSHHTYTQGEACS